MSAAHWVGMRNIALHQLLSLPFKAEQGIFSGQPLLSVGNHQKATCHIITSWGAGLQGVFRIAGSEEEAVETAGLCAMGEQQPLQSTSPADTPAARRASSRSPGAPSCIVRLRRTLLPTSPQIASLASHADVPHVLEGLPDSILSQLGWCMALAAVVHTKLICRTAESSAGS